MLPVCDMSLAGGIPGGDAGPLWSDSGPWTDLTVPVSVAEGARQLGGGRPDEATGPPRLLVLAEGYGGPVQVSRLDESIQALGVLFSALVAQHRGGGKEGGLQVGGEDVRVVGRQAPEEAH
jgi:hypothetical protein